MTSISRTHFSSYKSPRPAPVVPTRQSPAASSETSVRNLVSASLTNISRIKKPHNELTYDHFAHHYGNYAVRQGHVGIQLDKLRSWAWTRRLWLVLDNVRLYFCQKQDTAVIQTLMLHKVRQVELVNTKPYCLMVATSHSTWYLIFQDSVALYDWYHDIRIRCPLLRIGIPTDFRHELHVTYDSAAKEITGLPESWIAILSAWGVSPDSNYDRTQPETSEVTRPASEPASSPVQSSFPESHATVSPPTKKEEGRTKSRLRSASDATASRRVESTVSSAVASTQQFRKSPHRYREVQARNLTGAVRTVHLLPSSRHEACDIWKGEWTGSFGKRNVAIQIINVPDTISESERTRLSAILLREVKALHQLRHPNVLRTRGYCLDKSPLPVFISTWISGVNIRDYYRYTSPTLEKVEKIKLLTQVAAGLNYLHNFSRTILHADVRGTNIIITAKRTACLIGFGLNPILQELDSSPDPKNSYTLSFGISPRWTAVEVLRNGRRHLSHSSDVFSYARTVLEVMTGKDPFHYLFYDTEVGTTVLRGVLPRRPPFFDNDGLWQLLERCWNDKPNQRPSMAVILLHMEEILSLHEHPPLEANPQSSSAPP